MGIIPFHLHLQKLGERSDSRVSTLVHRHAFLFLIDGPSWDSVQNMQLAERASLYTSVTQAWVSQDLCTVDLVPFHDLDEPGLHIMDMFPDRVVLDAPVPPSGRRSVKIFWMNVVTFWLLCSNLLLGPLHMWQWSVMLPSLPFPCRLLQLGGCGTMVIWS